MIYDADGLSRIHPRNLWGRIATLEAKGWATDTLPCEVSWMSYIIDHVPHEIAEPALALITVGGVIRPCRNDQRWMATVLRSDIYQEC